MKKDFAALCSLTFTVLVLALTTPAAAQNVKIKMGAASSPPILDTITPYVAVEKGFFKKYGLDVEIVEFRGDVVGTKALLSNDIDVLLNVGATSAIVSPSVFLSFTIIIVSPGRSPALYAGEPPNGADTTVRPFRDPTIMPTP